MNVVYLIYDILFLGNFVCWIYALGIALRSLPILIDLLHRLHRGFIERIPLRIPLHKEPNAIYPYTAKLAPVEKLKL